MTYTHPEDPADRMEPAPTDTPWLQMEPHNARPRRPVATARPEDVAERRREGWIRRSDWSARTEELGPPDPSRWDAWRPFWIPSSKVCPAPRIWKSFEPDGQVGDLWRCPECGLLWQIKPIGDPHSRNAGTWSLLGFWRQMAFRSGWWPAR